jgi:16S rRNA (guanine527-N7)-methyltransferase
MDYKSFNALLKTIELEVNENQYQQLYDYYKLLVSENEKYNLTNITNIDEVFEKHFFDSISIVRMLDLSDKTILDIGAGAGFPLLPVRIFKPDIKATLLDATLKKVNFINMVIKSLKLNNIEALNGRAEEFEKKYDVVVARALAPLNQLLELSCNSIKKGGHLIAMKGSNYKEELKTAEKAISLLGFELVNVEAVDLKKSDIKHYNLLFKKIKQHDGFYPRSFAKISKQPL